MAATKVALAVVGKLFRTSCRLQLRKSSWTHRTCSMSAILG